MVSAERTFLGVRFPYVFVKATVACNKLNCCSVVPSVVDEGGVKVIGRLDGVAVQWFWSVLVVELYNFVVDVVIDV